MEFISPRTFGEALRRAYPCLPCLLLPRCSLVARGGIDDHVNDPVAGLSLQKRRKIRASQMFAPLLSVTSYSTCEETRDVLSEFTLRHGYGVPLFLFCKPRPLPTHQSGESCDAQQLSPHFYAGCGDMEIAKGSGVLVDMQAPTVNVRLVRCEQRTNLTDCMRSLLLQERLWHTEREFLSLYKSTPSCCFLSRGDLTRIAHVSQLQTVQPSYQLSLVWHRHGWYFEDPALAVEQSKCLPSSCGSHVGYWSAWVKPFTNLFSVVHTLDLQDIYQFFVEGYHSFINQEAFYRCISVGHKIAFCVQKGLEAGDYWASTGEALHSDNTEEGPAEIDKNGKSICSSCLPKKTCWFTLAELSKRRLQIRRGGKVFQQPVRYEGCGFFLHEAPEWFLLSRELVLQYYPLSFAAVRNIQFASGSDSLFNGMGATETSNFFCGEFVFVLQDTGAWHMYPSRHGVMNFHYKLTDVYDLQCANDKSLGEFAHALIFLDINIAFMLMRDWVTCDNQNRLKEGTLATEKQEKIIMFFKSLPSKLSTVSFITRFIAHCAQNANCAFLLPQTGPPAAQLNVSDGSSTAECTCCDRTMASPLKQSKQDVKSKDTQLLHSRCFSWNGKTDKISNDVFDGYYHSDADVDADDFPAVDRRVYTSGDRLNKAFTRSQGKVRQQNSIHQVSNLTTEVAEGIMKARKKEKQNTLSHIFAGVNFWDDTEENNIQKEENVVSDLGVVWIYFAYSVPAVNAYDTEIIPTTQLIDTT